MTTFIRNIMLSLSYILQHAMNSKYPVHCCIMLLYWPILPSSSLHVQCTYEYVPPTPTLPTTFILPMGLVPEYQFTACGDLNPGGWLQIFAWLGVLKLFWSVASCPSSQSICHMPKWVTFDPQRLEFIREEISKLYGYLSVFIVSSLY
jgi:hypothetical protein